MKIVSYNVNGLRPRLSSPSRTLAAFLDSLDADIICLQETKVTRQELTADIAVAEGYESFFSCTRTVKKGRIGYSGVATFCRVGMDPSSTSPILPVAADEGFTGLLHRSSNGEIEAEKGRVGCHDDVTQTELSRQELLQLDSEGRCLITDHGSFVLFNLYCPHVGCEDPDRLKFKIDFFRTLHRRWQGLLRQNRRIIAVGDFNISPYAIDSCAPGPDFDNNTCRKWLRSLLKLEGGPFWDVFRFFHQGRKDAYTCWSQSSGAEEFNYGTRIDLILAAGHCDHGVVPEPNSYEDLRHDFVQCEVEDSDILTHFRRAKPDAHPRWQGGRSLKLEGSDHAPIFVRLREQVAVEPHEVPPLAARFMPEIRGRQQSLVSLLKRQPLPANFGDGESKVKISQVEPRCEAAELSESDMKQVVCTKELDADSKIIKAGLKETSPFESAIGTRNSGYLQRTSTSTGRKRKLTASNSKKYDSQQDLRVFFESSSSQGKRNLVTAAEPTTNVIPHDHGLQQDSEENMKFVCSRAVKDEKLNTDILDIGSSQPREAESSCEIKTWKEMEEIDLDAGLMQQTRTAAAAVNVNAAWREIKQKMARAVPLCKGHREPCVGRVVKKPGPNLGRGFYVCTRAAGPPSNPEARCDHFEWASSFKK